ncbi:MAG: hypothetical protein OEU92_32440, partial [Alphaproteobacteria bacterium]|nr:hypothetical protein [Alphaproteobacteria bacterium]
MRVAARNPATIPDDIKTAAEPPSSAAMRCSRTPKFRKRDKTAAALYGFVVCSDLLECVGQGFDQVVAIL